ncbi:MAG: chloramphenicol acetyltransferase [Clostridia bacterium]|nr:chloramphenicol acetyltransferase [Clostridia bacterium]MBQ6865885.1 chloramphenicol acetyltransferase [Clostridia bacterium]MBQ7754323.1 chloramphenicol acetyltransferase [Clostridia bacterium]MBR0422128.1 chloramphenicol acetyltransferase [Clostridia bacterium]
MDRYIDVETWPRKDAYQLFSRGYLPYFSVTTPLDVTELYRYAKGEGLSFYRAMIYLVTRAMNELEPFRLRIRPQGIAVCDTVSPSYTTAGREGTFGICNVDYLPGETMADFCRRALEQEKRQGAEMVVEDDVRDDLIFFSCVPWFVTTSVLQEQPTDPDDSFPRVLWDRIHEEKGRKLVNFTLQLNHRLLDGAHVRDLLQRMEELMAPRHEL